MNAAAEPKTCPACSAKLENDGFCLACLLQEGILAEPASAAPVSVRALTLPCEFGGYKLVREVASGGMGIVYEAEDMRLRRVVALKVIRNAQFATREEAARFRAEMQAIGQLDHPSIVPIYESGEEEGMPYYTMRLAEGGSLADRLKKRGVLPEKEAAQMMSRIARAVQHAHDHGVLHRDLKPANILLDVAGKPMLSDFGLAKLLDAEFQLTRTHAHVGTPHYMSPEQAAGKAREITTASDTWALGVMLYQMLTGKLPFQGGSAVEVMRRITQEEPEISSSGKLISRSAANSVETKPMAPSISQISQIQRDMATLILRCLEKQPSRRLPSAGFLADELDRFLEGKPIQSRAVGSFEQLQKLALRHKAATLAILGTSVSLIAGTVVSTRQAVEARRAREVAEANERDAQEITTMALVTVRNLNTRQKGRSLNKEEVVDDLLQRIQAFEGDPLRKAGMLCQIAGILNGEQTLTAFQEAVSLAETVLDADSPRLWLMRYNVAAQMGHMEGRRMEGITALRAVLAWQEAHLPPKNYDTIFTQFSLGKCLYLNGQAEEAAERLEEVCRHAVSKRYKAFNLMNFRRFYLAALHDAGKKRYALQVGRGFISEALKLLGKEHVLTGEILYVHARHCREASLIDEAIATGRQAMEVFESVAGPDYNEAWDCLLMLDTLLHEHEGAESALALVRDALRRADEWCGAEHALTLGQAARCVDLQVELGRLQEAGDFGRFWLDRVNADDLPLSAAGLLRAEARCIGRLGRREEAVSLWHRLLALETGAEQVVMRLADQSELAAVLSECARHEEAVRLLKQTIKGMEGMPGDEARAHVSLARQRLEASQRALRESVSAGL